MTPRFSKFYALTLASVLGLWEADSAHAQVRENVPFMHDTADSIADLRTFKVAPGLDDAVVRVLGYATVGDHVGVSYRYDAGCVDSDTAGTVLVPDAGSGCWRIIYPDPGRVDVRYFGVVSSPEIGGCTGATDNQTALQRAADAKVPLLFPGSEDGNILTYCTAASFKPTVGFAGTGSTVTRLRAMATFTGDMLVDFVDLNESVQNFEDIDLDGADIIDHVLSTSDLSHANGGSGLHTFTRLKLRRGNDYQVDFPDTVGASGMETVGSVWTDVEIVGSDIMHLGVASDDITFIGLRVLLEGGASTVPIRISGPINTRFFGTYIGVFGDHDISGTDVTKSLIHIDTGGDQHIWEGLFLELFADLDNSVAIFTLIDYPPGVRLSNMRLIDNGNAVTNVNAVIEARPSGGTGHVDTPLDVSSINGFGAIDHLLHVFVQSAFYTSAQFPVRVDGVDDWAWGSLVGFRTNSDNTGGNDVVYLTGRHHDVVLDHGIEVASGPAISMRHRKPMIVANGNLDLIGANAAVARFTCPYDQTDIQEVVSVINGALTTGDATLTTAIAGTGVTGGVITITQSGSAAGDIDTATPTALNRCIKGQLVTVTVGGTNDAAVTGNVEIHFAPAA